MALSGRKEGQTLTVIVGSAAIFSCHSTLSIGSSVVPMKATFAFSMMPRTVSAGSF